MLRGFAFARRGLARQAAQNIEDVEPAPRAGSTSSIGERRRREQVIVMAIRQTLGNA